MAAEESGKDIQPSCEGAERILAAAEELFSRDGFDAVSINAIAEKAEVSKANVFHHFKTKNDLYLAVLKGACAHFCDYIDDFGSDRGPFPERLGSFALDHLKHVLERSEITRLIQRDLLENGPRRGQELAERVFGQNFARLVAIIRSGQGKAELRQDIDPAMVAVMVIGLNITFFQAADVFRHYPEVDFMDDPARYSKMAVDILLNGILPRGGETK